MPMLNEGDANNLNKLLSALNALGSDVTGELSFRTGRIVWHTYQWLYETNPKTTGPVSDDSLVFRHVEYDGPSKWHEDFDHQ